MPELVYTSFEDIDKKYGQLRAGFKTGKLKSIEYRKYQLLQLMHLVKENSDKLELALESDLGRPVVESRFLEISSTIGEALAAYDGVAKWAKPETPAFNLVFSAMKPTIHKEPKGTVLIISPFNYPVWLTLGPLAGAIAAGNTILLKPSESTPAVSSLLAELVSKYLDNDLVQVANGAVVETTKILEFQWDHILYTGSGRVGRIVSTAAAKHLTPVSLELGGKSPVIIDPGCDLETTARRLLWGKIANAGQTCVAPDYVLVPRSFQDTLVEALKKRYEEFYPEGPKAQKAYGRIATKQAWSRLTGLLDKTNGTIVVGGERDEDTKYIAPTIVSNVAADDSLMTEEIFGPILPIVPVEDVDEAIRYVNSQDHPLVIYVFSRDSAFKNRVLTNTQSGGFAANDVVLLPGVAGLPFGGTGPSGSGYHTGKFSFDMFTHLRAGMDSPSWLDKVLGFRYPPYTANKLKATSRLDQRIPSKPEGPPTLVASGDTSGLRTWFVLSLAIAMVGLVVERTKILGPGLGIQLRG